MSIVGSVSPIPELPPLTMVGRHAGSATPARRPDDASSLRATTDLRVRLSGLHERSKGLQKTTAVVDAADESLVRTGELLERARSAVLEDEARQVEPVLNSIDEVSAGPRLAGASVLHEGVTLRAAGGEVDVRPMTTMDLGAVVESGRTHRLSDIRSGGTLDPLARRAGAIRCIDAAAGEVRSVRRQLGEFRAGSLVPAQRDALVAMLAETGSAGIDETRARDAAREIRNRVLARTAEQWKGAEPGAVLTLLIPGACL